ncbi:MAG: hypothetical protein KJ638_09575 [Chloroflexi bacterium]|nr:hypothetical protein [Chloroflexota bacterium]
MLLRRAALDQVGLLDDEVHESTEKRLSHRRVRSTLRVCFAKIAEIF